MRLDLSEKPWRHEAVMEYPGLIRKVENVLRPGIKVPFTHENPLPAAIQPGRVARVSGDLDCFSICGRRAVRDGQI